MATADAPVMPARGWNELVQLSRARGTRIKRRRRILATAPAAALAVVISVALLGAGNATQRLRTDPRRIQTPTDPHPPDGSVRPETRSPSPGDGPGAGGARSSHALEDGSLRADGGPLATTVTLPVPGLIPSDRVAFNIVNGASAQIAVAQGDGSRVVTLTQPVGNNRNPAWSPDGKTIAFESSRRLYTKYFSREVFDLFLMDADGSNQRLLVSTLGEQNGVSWPAWSPDGRHLVFAEPPVGEMQSDLWIVNADGSGRRNLTRTTNTTEMLADWSPDGRRIAFTNPGHGLWTIRPDGSDRRLLLNDASDAAWSPDGRRITYMGGVNGAFEIKVANADGGDARVVFAQQPGGVVGHPAFTADSNYVVYDADPDGVQDTYINTTNPRVEGGPLPAAIYVIRVDRENSRQVTTPLQTDNHSYPSVRQRA
jgi:Tol biopolymer transport system component